jgi:hypothetical protein
MYGIETINSLNRKNDEAARIIDSHDVGHLHPLAPADQAVREHLANAQETKDRILNGAKG